MKSPTNFLDKYPKTKKFLEETGMTIDQALIWTEQEIKKLQLDQQGE
jgi:hypothetical protein